MTRRTRRPAAADEGPGPVRRRFGQNFLHDPGILDRIVRAIDPQPDDRMLEIGPGRGALTAPLLDRLQKLDAVEIDRDLAAALRSHFPPERLTLHTGDALELDLAAVGETPPAGWRVVGNLPYNISTPLLFHLLAQSEHIRDMHFLLQREVVERITAVPGSKRYGRLSVMVAARARATELLGVPPGAFHPPPKVHSAVVRIVPDAEPRVPAARLPAFAALVNRAFSNRRKTLRRGLAGLLEAADIEAAGLDPGQRPETVDVAGFDALARRIPESAGAE
ncbi:16S rRNA (adenine(1518)-N(6)/adenine(1519)-N(6))-dimethyltransferase RsmA [Thioalkalivibrio sp. ALE20]|uniref:16S rRNA (adenine(1518)-N(6)/adenine(1519)-N(6))- dimethyltransferase RsmA n=1 Tax=Thioalkalivibrio sp. ALE20 TaxID=545275 RepID=UPI00036F3243|nr:16S rRNA (adenine(1518)-N(6)/adenine(1519)-N(6))-dimethyltransferase RsmA [Thioalkalivibrio sp. ALE20]